MEIVYNGNKYVLVSSNFEETEISVNNDCKSLIVILYNDFTYDLVEGEYQNILETYSLILSGSKVNSAICGVALFVLESCIMNK